MELHRRVDEAIEQGETWRAKEILRGNIGSGSYDSLLYERYGLLLMELGELVEAGKYLVLQDDPSTASCRRRPEPSPRPPGFRQKPESVCQGQRFAKTAWVVRWTFVPEDKVGMHECEPPLDMANIRAMIMQSRRVVRTSHLKENVPK